MGNDSHSQLIPPVPRQRQAGFLYKEKIVHVVDFLQSKISEMKVSHQKQGWKGVHTDIFPKFQDYTSHCIAKHDDCEIGKSLITVTFRRRPSAIFATQQLSCMNNSTCLFRSLLLHVFLLIALVQAHASKTNWIGSLGATDWNTAANWDNGVPTAIDSAVITGGNLITNLNVLISSDAEALHVSVGDHCILGILLTVTLTVADAPSIGINIENYGVFQNFGILNIFNTPNGINVRGNFENHGDCKIDESSQSGIVMLGSASVKNKGTIVILNSGAGLNGIGDGIYKRIHQNLIYTKL